MNSAEFKKRRHELRKLMQPDSVAIIPANREVTRSRDTEFPFRQDSYFYYLTGITEPEGLLVIGNSEPDEETLFVLPADPEQEIWHGRRIGAEQAAEVSGVEGVFTTVDVEPQLPLLTDDRSVLYYPQGLYQWHDDFVQDLLAQLRGQRRKYKVPTTQSDVRVLLDEQRLIKSESEIKLMREAARISVDAHMRAMKFARPGVWEYQVAAELHHEFVMQGGAAPAYGTICGSGENACILHYTENQSQLKSGDLLLIDAGVEFQGYAADITRTFPVSGIFSEPQKILYSLVLEAQEAALATLKPGNTMPEAHEASARVITEGLVRLGILQGDPEQHLKDKTYRKFYMHSLGHWLGLDVHDVGTYEANGAPRELEAGMVLTIEPGLYIAPDADVDEQWKGIGIRIEDDILITDEGYENLTDGVPKSVQEIETLLAERDT